VIERTRHDHVETKVIVILEASKLGGDFTDAIGAGGAHGVVLADGDLLGADEAILGTGTGDMDTGLGGVATHRLEEVEGPLDVGTHRVDRSLPGSARVALGGEVEDTIGASGGDRLVDSEGVLDIALVEGDVATKVGDRARIATPALEGVELEAGDCK
jgi:hypothetical protein